MVASLSATLSTILKTRTISSDEPMMVFSSWPFLSFALQELVLAADLAHLDRVAHDELDLIVLGVLEQVLERAEIHRVDRRLLQEA